MCSFTGDTALIYTQAERVTEKNEREYQGEGLGQWYTTGTACMVHGKKL